MIRLKLKAVANITWFFIAFFIAAASMAVETKSVLEKGMVDFDYFKGKEAKVEVNISGNLLNMAANIVAKEEPQISKMLLDLKGVFVRIFSAESLAGEKIEDIIKRYEQKLLKEGWEPMVRVRDKNDNVMVLTLSEQNLFKGIFVATSSKNEVVLVNLFGSIKPENIAELSKGKLPIPGLDQLKNFPSSGSTNMNSIPQEGKFKTLKEPKELKEKEAKAQKFKWKGKEGKEKEKELDKDKGGKEKGKALEKESSQTEEKSEEKQQEKQKEKQQEKQESDSSQSEK